MSLRTQIFLDFLLGLSIVSFISGMVMGFLL